MMVHELFTKEDHNDYILIVRKPYSQNDFEQNKKSLQNLYLKMKKKNGEVKMVLDPRTKKYLKIFAVIALVFIFTGCTSNVDKNGHLLASRAITESTPWSLKAGFLILFLQFLSQRESY